MHIHQKHEILGPLAGKESKYEADLARTFLLYPGDRPGHRGLRPVCRRLGALTPEQLEQLQGLDAVLLPVGGYYTIDAVQADAAARQLGARAVVPIHYRGAGFGYDVIAPLDDFLALREDVVRYPGPALTLEANMPVQTAVLERFD